MLANKSSMGRSISHEHEETKNAFDNIKYLEKREESQQIETENSASHTLAGFFFYCTSAKITGIASKRKWISIGPTTFLVLART